MITHLYKLIKRKIFYSNLVHLIFVVSKMSKYMVQQIRSTSGVTDGSIRNLQAKDADIV